MAQRRTPGAGAAAGWKRLFVVLAVAACAFSCMVSAAQRDYAFLTLDHGHGLAQNSVTVLLQDRTGYVWAATQAGLQRYDGERFRDLGELLDDATALPRGTVTALAEAPDGTLWIGTASHGLLQVDAARRTLRTIGAPTVSTGRIDALAVQPDGAVWVCDTNGIGLLRSDAGGLERLLRFDGASPHDVRTHAIALDTLGHAWSATDAGLYRIAPNGEMLHVSQPAAPHAVLSDGQGTVWIGAASGLWRIDAGETQARRVWPDAPSAAGTPEHGSGRVVRGLAQDSHGVLWMPLADAGLLRFDPATGTTQHVPQHAGFDGGAPDGSRVTAWMIDRSDLLWVGGDSRGVMLGDIRNPRFQTIIDPGLDGDPTRPATHGVRALLESADGLWIASGGGALKRYAFASDRFERFDALLRKAAFGAADASELIRTQALASDDDGGLWVGTDRGLFAIDTAMRAARYIVIDPLPASHPVHALLRRRDGSLWAAVPDRGLVRRDPDGRWRTVGEGVGQSEILVLFEDSQRRLWAGGIDGLDLYAANGQHLQRFRHAPADPTSLSGMPVRALHEGADGTLWIGGQHGLDRLIVDGGALRFERVGERIGLLDRAVYGIVEDASGHLWLSGNTGLTRYHRTSEAQRHFGMRAGVQGFESGGGAALQLRDGRLVFGGTRGITLFRPETIQDSTFAPPLVLLDARIGDAPLRIAHRSDHALDVPHAGRVLHLTVSALDFAAPSENRYAFRLDGHDTDWVEAGARPHVTYVDLPAGDYLFRARATNRDGVWSTQELQLPIRVVPPWWDSTTARIAYLCVALALLTWLMRTIRRRRRHRQELMAQLREREERLKLSLWGSGDEFWDWDVRANQLYRLGADQLLGLRSEHDMSADEWRSRAVHPDDLPRVQQILQEHILGKSEFFESEHRIRNARGEWIWVRSRGKVVERDADNNPLRIAGTAHDISATRRAERERRIASEVLRSMSEAVAVMSLDFRFVSVNASFSRITAYDEDDVIGLSAGLLNSKQNGDDFHRRQRDTLDTSGRWKGEMWLRRRDGEEFLAWMEISQVGDSGGDRSHYVAVLNDITDKKRAEQELRYLANYDTLTGLPNRSLLAERLARAVVRARRMESRVGVLFLDLDRFKDINDSLGHAAGDRILKAAAARLLRTVGDTDTVARLGGDEFTVVIEDIADLARAETVAERIVAAFADPLEIDGRSDVTISPSIGISLYPDHGLVPTDLLKFADTAMYQAKDRGRNTWQVYTEAMDAEARRRAVMIAALRRALDRGEFSLEFQPRLSLADGRISGVEALLRWHSSELGLIHPSVFVPVAEETGLILSIGEWVLREACMTLQRWSRQGLDDVGMAVNVSVLQLLRGRLPELARGVLAEVDVPPQRLELEVTESMVMANAEQTISVLRELKDLGVSIAIDDFGTGYSSLIYLKRLPIDTLKIDKEFVGDLTQDPDDEAITATVITMAHSLGLNVVAEGVETEEQLFYLREQGCDEIQGFWLAPPLDVHHCLAFIRNYRAQPRLAALSY